MFSLNVVSEGRVRRYSITLAGSAGWEVKLEENTALCWREVYEDWHRVERSRARVQREISELLSHGWTIEPKPPIEPKPAVS